ncbi:MAG TPA: MBL fold metallo-hydrolase [Desulfomonilaceae bacterium]|nr:MBL fold metallo-hydrolase [Desulfomonilaceae bacterium]
MIKIQKIGNVTKFRLARTLFGRGLYFTAAYLLDGLLVDTGCAYTVTELTAALQDLEVHTVINTHSHEDHVAANAALQKCFGARVLAHPDALPFLANPRKVRLRPYQLVMWGYPEPSTGDPVGEFLETDNCRFHIIHTPGHSPDHICLFDPQERRLFTGDAYVGGRDRALRLDYNIWEIVRSLKKMAALEPRVIFAGSGTVKDDARQELAGKIDYLEDIGGRVLDLHRKGWSRRRIRLELLGKEMSIAYYTLGHFSGKNLVRSFIEDYTDAPGGTISYTRDRPRSN